MVVRVSRRKSNCTQPSDRVFIFGPRRRKCRGYRRDQCAPRHWRFHLRRRPSLTPSQVAEGEHSQPRTYCPDACRLHRHSLGTGMRAHRLGVPDLPDLPSVSRGHVGRARGEQLFGWPILTVLAVLYRTGRMNRRRRKAQKQAHATVSTTR